MTRDAAIAAAGAIYSAAVHDLARLAAAEGPEAVAAAVHRPGSRITPQEIAARWQPQARAA